MSFTLNSCKGIKPIIIHGSSSIIEAQIKLTEPENTLNIIALWTVQQTINNPNWTTEDYNIILLDFTVIRISIRFIQHVESSESGLKSIVTLGQLERDIALTDDTEFDGSFESQLESVQNEGTAIVQCTLKTKPTDEVKMKKNI